MIILYSMDFFKVGILMVVIEFCFFQLVFLEYYYDFYEIVIVEQGLGIYVFNGQFYIIGGGLVCFICDYDCYFYEYMDNLCLINVFYCVLDVFCFFVGVS